VSEFRRQSFTATSEILEARFFGSDELPETTGGTRRRIAEVMTGAAPAVDW
jgi:hypothetical protein